MEGRIHPLRRVVVINSRAFKAIGTVIYRQKSGEIFALLDKGSFFWGKDTDIVGLCDPIPADPVKDAEPERKIILSRQIDNDPEHPINWAFRHFKTAGLEILQGEYE